MSPRGDGRAVFSKAPSPFEGEGTGLSTDSAAKLGVHMQKDGIKPLSSTTYKINSKRVKRLHVRTKSIKLLEKNRGRKLHSIAFGEDS